MLNRFFRDLLVRIYWLKRVSPCVGPLEMDVKQGFSTAGARDLELKARAPARFSSLSSARG